MKIFIVSIFAAVLLLAKADPKPGGYTLKGGVDHRILAEKPAGHFRDAQHAGKL